jgi:hypothetical protein
MSGRTIGNFILMTVICIVVFWMFMAIHGARAQGIVRGLPVEANGNVIEGLSQCREVSMLVATCLHNQSGKQWKVIWHGGMGRLDALDDGQELAVARLGPGEPRAFRYRHTPPGQLPTCDAAEMIYWLAGSRRPLGAVTPPKLIGTIQGKNLCSASVMESGYVTYTIELMDDGRWWVHP